MMAVSAATLPVGADWSYEVKWDGYRAQAVKDGAVVSLASRNLKNITSQYPAIVEAAARVRAKTAVLDGEIVALDADAPGRRSDAWVKVRFARHQEFVIGGYKANATNFDLVLKCL